jgi:hypothetical protein
MNQWELGSTFCGAPINPITSAQQEANWKHVFRSINVVSLVDILPDAVLWSLSGRNISTELSMP